MRARLLLSVFGLLLVTIACTPATTPPAAPAAADAQAKYGGILNLRLANGDFFDFDMSYTAKSQPNPKATSLAYNGLLGFKHGPDIAYGDLILVPQIAERWQASPDARTFTFTLRKGVKFADLPPVGGRAVTAADVKWSLEYWSRTGEFKGKGLPVGLFDYMLEGLTRIDTPDPATVTLSFDKPFAPMLNYAATVNLPVVPREIYEQDKHLKNRLVGTGPFQLDQASSQIGARWVFKKNPNYWDQGHPYVDEIRYLVLQDDTTALAAFKTKQIDIFSPTEAQGEQVKREVTEATVLTNVAPAPQTLYIGVSHPPFNDVRLRRALSLAIDRNEFVSTFSGGKGGWAMAGAFPDTWSQAEIRGLLQYDPQQARSLLAEAGYSNGLDVDFLMRGQPDLITRSQAELLQAQLKKVGFNLKIRITPDKAAGTKNLYDGAFDLIILTAVISADVDSFLYGRYHSTSATNYSKVNDPKLDQMIEAQRREADPAKRRELVRQATRYLNIDTTLGLVLYNGMAYDAYQPYVKNFYPRWDLEDVGAADIWLAK